MRIPNHLSPGDKVGIVCPARKISEAELAPAIADLNAWGFVPVLGKHALAIDHQYAGTDAQRTEDLQTMIDDPSIKAILCGRGGYGSLRIVDAIDFKAMRSHPKWLIGFSDITTFCIAAFNKDIATIHGPMAISWNGETGDKASREYLRQILIGKSPNYSYTPIEQEQLRTGKARGRLIGGNLSMLSQLLGTPSDFDTKGCILFLEDLSEYLYHLDRMVVHLKRGGKFDKLAGLIVGSFSDIQDNSTPFGKTVPEIILDALGDADIPVCFDFPTGHSPLNYPLIHGGLATLSVSHSHVELSMELK